LSSLLLSSASPASLLLLPSPPSSQPPSSQPASMPASPCPALPFHFQNACAR
jgi:hypothetical protein